MFSGQNDLLDQAYSPQVVRFFMLQAHYRKPLDFSNKALKASEKGLQRLLEAVKTLDNIKPAEKTTPDFSDIKQKSFDALNDDLNSPILIAHLFDGVRMINTLKTGKESISADDLQDLKKFYSEMLFDILGLKQENKATDNNEKFGDLVEMILDIRAKAKKNKDFQTSDSIRDKMKAMGIIVKDTPHGPEWSMED